eukprot:COSAG02_NODE_56626_length_284_cov_1.389189_1_plen_51_part_01
MNANPTHVTKFKLRQWSCIPYCNFIATPHQRTTTVIVASCPRDGYASPLSV